MTVIIEINPIQIAPFQNFQKLRVGSGYKKAYDDVIAMRRGKRVWKRLKNTKMSTSSIKFLWRQQLSSEISKVAILSNFKSGVKIVAFPLLISKLLLWYW